MLFSLSNKAIATDQLVEIKATEYLLLTIGGNEICEIPIATDQLSYDTPTLYCHRVLTGGITINERMKFSMVSFKDSIPWYISIHSKYGKCIPVQKSFNFGMLKTLLTIIMITDRNYSTRITVPMLRDNFINNNEIIMSHWQELQYQRSGTHDTPTQSVWNQSSHPSHSIILSRYVSGMRQVQ